MGYEIVLSYMFPGMGVEFGLADAGFRPVGRDAGGVREALRGAGG